MTEDMNRESDAAAEAAAEVTAEAAAEEEAEEDAEEREPAEHVELDPHSGFNGFFPGEG